MDRLPDSEIEPQAIAAWQEANDVSEGDPAAPGTNLVAGDHVLLVGWLPIVVYGPAPAAEGCFSGGYAPYFGTEPMAFLTTDITDRIGPNGETMPIVDEPEGEEEVEVP
jgi:hypothetical protein